MASNSNLVNDLAIDLYHAKSYGTGMLGRSTTPPLSTQWLQLTDKKVWDRLKTPQNFEVLEHCAEQMVLEYQELKSTDRNDGSRVRINTVEQWRSLGQSVFCNIDDILGTYKISKPQIAGESQVLPIAAKHTMMYFISGGALLGAKHYQPEINDIFLLKDVTELAGILALFLGIISLNSIPPALSVLADGGGVYHPIFRTVFLPTDQAFSQAQAKRYLGHEYGHRLACQAFNPVAHIGANLFCSAIWEGFADSISDLHAESSQHQDPEFYFESLRRRALNLSTVYIKLAKDLDHKQNINCRDHVYYEGRWNLEVNPYIIGDAVMAVVRTKHGPTVQRRFLDGDLTPFIESFSPC